MTIPTVLGESNSFISTLQSKNPYVDAANSLRKTLGDELTTKVEEYVMYPTSNTDAPDSLNSKNNNMLLQMDENPIIISSDRNNNNPSINSKASKTSARDRIAPTSIRE